MPWDLSNGQRPLPERIAGLVATLQPRLRVQVIYNHFHGSNVLVSSGLDLAVQGVIDFGDMIFAPLVQDLAVVVASLIHRADDPSRAAAALVCGYKSASSPEDADLAALQDLVLARLIFQVAMVAYHTQVIGRKGLGIEALQPIYMAAIEQLSQVPEAQFRAAMLPVIPSAPVAPQTTSGLMQRRQAVMGHAYTC